MLQGYCVKCKVKRDMVNGKESIAKNGTPVMKAPCKVCGTIMTRFLPGGKKGKAAKK